MVGSLIWVCLSFWWVKGAERHWLRRKERTKPSKSSCLFISLSLPAHKETKWADEERRWGKRGMDWIVFWWVIGGASRRQPAKREDEPIPPAFSFFSNWWRNESIDEKKREGRRESGRTKQKSKPNNKRKLIEINLLFCWRCLFFCGVSWAGQKRWPTTPIPFKAAWLWASLELELGWPALFQHTRCSPPLTQRVVAAAN